MSPQWCVVRCRWSRTRRRRDWRSTPARARITHSLSTPTEREPETFAATRPRTACRCPAAADDCRCSAAAVDTSKGSGSRSPSTATAWADRARCACARLASPRDVGPCRMRTTFPLRGHIRSRSPAQAISPRNRRSVAVPPRFKRGRARIAIELDLGCRGPFRQPVPSTRFALALADAALERVTPAPHDQPHVPCPSLTAVPGRTSRDGYAPRARESSRCLIG
jgi:hypothetical protein